MSNKLLPPNSSELENLLSQVADRATDIPLAIRDILNPWKCPTSLLPWLAWSRSVDEWSDSWSEQKKRAVIAASFSVHKTKGTIGSVKRAIGALGYNTRVSEWFETNGPAYTFDINVDISNEPLSENQYRQLIAIVNNTKNARSAYQLKVNATVDGQFHVAAAITIADLIIVNPYQPEVASSRGQIAIGLFTQISEIIEVNPL
ncbi:phage tail protein I [uncultured Rheinheimera sp.]|uniref:phage tail protein I n=1 Tax=uncultured Rheinheimera sp. TaxID=400532 RepID=UPI00259A9662|nr:phage tail protein I [uncultured Rheinheimera sp.]